MHASSQSALRLRYEAGKIGMPDKAALLIVNVDRQLVEVSLSGSTHPRVFPVSTSREGLGECLNSFKTPRGFHEIVERYGDGAPAGMIYESRVPTGQVLSGDQWKQPDGDKILTRILRISGRESGFNQGGEVDSYERMIYLHGTNQEQYVGKAPSSHGCIRMLNHDIITLYDLLLGVPAWCWIGTSCRT